MILLDSPTFRRLGRQLSSRLKFSRGECRTFGACLLTFLSLLTLLNSLYGYMPLRPFNYITLTDMSKEWHAKT